MEKLKGLSPPTTVGLASSSAATVAVVEETQRPYVLSSEHPVGPPLASCESALGNLGNDTACIDSGGQLLFLESLGPYAQWQTHQAGAQTYFPPRGNSGNAEAPKTIELPPFRSRKRPPVAMKFCRIVRFPPFRLPMRSTKRRRLNSPTRSWRGFAKGSRNPL